MRGVNIYQDALGTNVPPDPSQIGPNPSLEFDSYMTGGMNTVAPSTPGLMLVVYGGAVDLGDTALTFSTTKIDAAWGSAETTLPSGNLMLARITLSDNAHGTFKYRIGFDNGTPYSIYMLEGVIVDGVMSVPEPSTITLLLCGLAGLALLRRRR